MINSANSSSFIPLNSPWKHSSVVWSPSEICFKLCWMYLRSISLCFFLSRLSLVVYLYLKLKSILFFWFILNEYDAWRETFSLFETDGVYLDAFSVVSSKFFSKSKSIFIFDSSLMILFRNFNFSSLDVLPGSKPRDSRLTCQTRSVLVSNL